MIHRLGGGAAADPGRISGRVRRRAGGAGAAQPGRGLVAKRCLNFHLTGGQWALAMIPKWKSSLGSAWKP